MLVGNRIPTFVRERGQVKAETAFRSSPFLVRILQIFVYDANALMIASLAIYNLRILTVYFVGIAVGINFMRGRKAE